MFRFDFGTKKEMTQLLLESFQQLRMLKQTVLLYSICLILIGESLNISDAQQLWNDTLNSLNTTQYVSIRWYSEASMELHYQDYHDHYRIDPIVW